MSAPTQPSNTQIIAGNSFWYGLEVVFGLFGAFVVSVAVARAIGPQRLGYYSYVVWLTNMTAQIGTFGLPMTTRKYMAEYLNSGRPGLAKSIYLTGLKFQILIAAGVTAIAMALVLLAGRPDYRFISALLVMSMAPRMIGFIPSQANNAAEAMRRNTAAGVVGAIVTVVITVVSLWVGWDLAGVAAANIAGAALETGWKLRSVQGWLGAVAPEEIPAELRRRLFMYSGQGLGLMLLNIVVWDRSDVVFLKWLNSDIQQVTFFSIAFNLTERVLILPTAFVASVSVTMMAQFGRGEEKVRTLLVDGARYAFLLAFPLLCGMACVSGPAVLLIYGERFRPMIPVLAVVAVMAIPKSLIGAPTSMLQTTENQGFLLKWGWICGGVDVLLDILVTPGMGALGAAVANGTAQTMCAAVLWVHVYRRFGVDPRLAAFGKIVLSGFGMAAATILMGRAVPGYAGLAVSVTAGALVWFALLRLTGALDDNDRQRFLGIRRAVPARFQPAWATLVNLLAPERA